MGNKIPQRHCFLNVASLSERHEIRVEPEALAKLLAVDSTDQLEAEAACSVVALGYANVVIDDEKTEISIKLPRIAAGAVAVLQRAKMIGKINGFVLVTNSFNEFRTIGSDVMKAQKFAEAVRKNLRELNATGVLIEWLRPLPSDKAALNTIVKTLAETMQYDPALKMPKYNGVRLLIGLNVLPTARAAHDIQLVLKNVDYLNVIVDQKEELKSKRTSYTNELLTDLVNTARNNNKLSWLSSSSNETLRRINVGIQLAPISWTLSQFQREVGGLVTSPGLNGPISGIPGTLNAGEICIVGDEKRVAKLSGRRALRNFSISNSTSAHPFASSAPDRQWVAYETPESLLLKLRQAKTMLQKLNGVYLMDLQADDPQGLCGKDNEFALTKSVLRYSNELSPLKS